MPTTLSPDVLSRKAAFDLADAIGEFLDTVRGLVATTPKNRPAEFSHPWNFDFSFRVPSPESAEAAGAGRCIGDGYPDGDITEEWTSESLYFSAIDAYRQGIMGNGREINNLIDQGIDRWCRIVFDRPPCAWTSELRFEVTAVEKICARVFGRRSYPRGTFGRFRRSEKRQFLKLIHALETKIDRLYALDFETAKSDASEDQREYPRGLDPSIPRAAHAAGDSFEQEVFFRDLASWAARELKGKQRRCIELLAEEMGAVPIADLACDNAIDWGNDFDEPFKSMVRALTPKLGKQGWRIYRHDNEARIQKTGQK